MRKILLTVLLGGSVLHAASQSSSESLMAGMKAARANDRVQAERSFTEAVAYAPDEARNWYHRAVNRLAMGDATGAIRDLDQAILLQPDDVHALLRRSEALVQLGRPWDARRDLRQVLAHHTSGPAAETALLELGRYALKEGDRKAALDHFDRLVSIAPLDAVAHMERGSVRAAIQQEDEALVDLERAVDLDPMLEAAHARLGLVLLRMDRVQEACYALRSAHDLGDRSVEGALVLHCGR
jgi:tetratricopeptide (TPR) repeat protein